MRLGIRKKLTPQRVILLTILSLIAGYAIYCIFTHLNPNGLNSDIVNENLYKKLSWEKKTLFPEGYICSKESFSTRPVLLFWLYYGITRRFLLSIQLECVTVLLLGLLAFNWLCKESEISATPRLVGMSIFLLWAVWDPLEYTAFLYGDAYANFVLAYLCTLALYVRLRKEISKERNLLSRPIVLRAAAIWIVSATMGYGTPKITIALFLPIVVVEIWRIFIKYINKEKINYVDYSMSAIGIVAALIGLCAYALFLRAHRDFIDSTTFAIASLGDILSWDVLAAQANAILSACGLSFGGDLKSWYGIRYLCRGAIFFLTCVFVARSIKERDRNAIPYICVSLLVLFLAEVLHAAESMHVPTDTSRRYYFPIIILIPLACAMACEKWTLTEIKSIQRFPYLIGILTIICIFTSGVVGQEKQYKNETPVLAEVAEYIESNHYQYVTATYEYAGVITGYTDCAVESQSGTIGDLSHRYWMIDRNLYYDERIGVPNILLLTDDEEEYILSENNSAALLLKDYAEKVNEIGTFNLYALNENPFTLVKKIEAKYAAGLPAEGEDYKIDYPGSIGFQHRDSELNEQGELVSDGSQSCILWGPYSQSVEGIYDITLHYVVDSYTDDDSGLFDVALNAERQASVEFYADEQSATISGVVLSGGAAFEARVEVPAGMTVRVRSIEYKRTGE